MKLKLKSQSLQVYVWTQRFSSSVTLITSLVYFCAALKAVQEYNKWQISPRLQCRDGDGI